MLQINEKEVRWILFDGAIAFCQEKFLKKSANYEYVALKD